MKKSLFASLLCLLAVSASAQQHQNLLRFGLNYRTPENLLKAIPSTQAGETAAMPSPGNDNSVQAFSNLLTLTHQDSRLGYFKANCVPMMYDKNTKNVYLLWNEITFPANNTIGVNLKLYWSTASSGYKSFSSTPKIFYTSSTDFLGAPQLAVMNPDGAKSNIDSLNFMAMVLQYPQSAQYFPTTPTFFLKTSTAVADPFPITAPDNNNSQQYSFGAGSLVGFWNSAAEGCIHAGVLDPPNSSVQYGQYGCLVYEASEQTENSSLPSAWNNSQFKAAPAATNSYNGPMSVDASPDGTCYAAVNDIFTDDDTRVISFSTSADLGKTWSDFSKIPSSTFSEYATSQGLAKMFAIQVYQQDAFIVTADKRFSYIFRAALYDGADALGAIQIVEAEYNNGSWAMRKVADFNDVPYVYYSIDSLNNVNNYSKIKPLRSLNPLGNEVEVARTADGENIVVKWIDYNVGLGPTVYSPALTVVDQDQQTGELSDVDIDTVYNTDVFIASRLLNSSEWSKSKNLTNDKNYDFGTHMPRTVPAIDKIPLTSARVFDKSKFTGSSQTAVMLKGTSNDILQRVINIASNVGYGLFSAVTSVETEEAAAAAGYHLGNANPSPANDVADISYTTTQAAHVVVTLSNVLGEKVANVFEGSVEPGVHGVSMNTANLASGAYIVSMNINGFTLTKTMVVSH